LAKGVPFDDLDRGGDAYRGERGTLAEARASDLGDLRARCKGDGLQLRAVLKGFVHEEPHVFADVHVGHVFGNIFEVVFVEMKD
jgi:hypothetical protein